LSSVSESKQKNDFPNKALQHMGLIFRDAVPWARLHFEFLPQRGYQIELPFANDGAIASINARFVLWSERTRPFRKSGVSGD